MNISQKLEDKLRSRIENNSLRSLNQNQQRIDFSSNDYLGFAQSEWLFDRVHEYLVNENIKHNGSTGSRLLSGNHVLHEALEAQLAQNHKAPAALVYNSGYDANLGLLGCIPQRTDIILFDKLSHASIRDGMQLSHAKLIGYEHNNLVQLEQKLIKIRQKKQFENEIYVVTESIFSMDGDSPDLVTMTNICNQYDARLIVDEAHALGVFGLGLIQKLGLQDQVFARVMTFGKALGCHGACVLGSNDLKKYLLNYSRPFIYTTALPPHSLATILIAYNNLTADIEKRLAGKIEYFKKVCDELKLSHFFIESDSSIQSCIISENERVKSIATQLQNNNYEVKAILSPTVAFGEERLRFCIHVFNNNSEIKQVLSLLNQALNEYD